MGQRHVPHSANIFLARRLDNQIKQIAQYISDSGTYPIKLMNRFLDDIFNIYLGSTANLHKFLEEINKIHPNIKFTMTHTTPNSEPEASKCSFLPTARFSTIPGHVFVNQRRQDNSGPLQETN